MSVSSRTTIVALIVVVLSVAACSSNNNNGAVSTTTTRRTTTTAAADGALADVTALTKWLATQGVQCPVQPDKKSCRLTSAKGETIVPEVVDAAVAPDEDAMDPFFLAHHDGYMVTAGDTTWALHMQSRANADALIRVMPEASIFSALPSAPPGVSTTAGG